MSDKYDSVNECTQEISESKKLHVLWVWQNAMKFIKQLANVTVTLAFSCCRTWTCEVSANNQNTWQISRSI